MDIKTEIKDLLKGLIVADFTQLAQGPWATQMLGDMAQYFIGKRYLVFSSKLI